MNIHDRKTIYKNLFNQILSSTPQVGKGEIVEQNWQNLVARLYNQAVAVANKKYAKHIGAGGKYMPHQGKRETARRLWQAL